MDSEAIVVSAREGVHTIALSRPEARNALTDEMLSALRDALERGAREDPVRGVVLTGAGEAFCAGADLARFEGGPDQRSFRFESHRLTEVVNLIERIEKPIVAAINGIAVGLGVQLALACDLRVGAESARLAFNEGRLGLLPTHGGVTRLVHLVGLARARDLLLASATIDARRAHELGLLTEVVPDLELLGAAHELLASALARAPQSYGLVKRLLAIAAGMDLQAAMVAETIGQSLLVRTDDHAEGLRAAREGRPPTFTGR